MVERLLAEVETLVELPRRGRVVPELERPEVRELLFGNYREALQTYVLRRTPEALTTAFRGQAEEFSRDPLRDPHPAACVGSPCVYHGTCRSFAQKDARV